MANLYVARLKEGETVSIGLCKYYFSLRKPICMCKFLKENDLLEIFAEPERSFGKIQECNYICHISMQQQGTEFWEAYSIQDKKGTFQGNRLILEDAREVEIDMSSDLSSLWRSVQLSSLRQVVREKGVPEEIINNLP